VKRSVIPAMMWALGGLLVVASVLFFFAREERRTFPSAASPRPSGTMAFAELLREDGFEVSVSGSPNPRFDRGNLVIVYQVGVRRDRFTIFGDEPDGDGPSEKRDPLTAMPAVERALARHIALGGRVLMIGVPENFDEASKSTVELGVLRWDSTAEAVLVSGSTSTIRAEDLIAERAPLLPRERSAVIPTWVGTDGSSFIEAVSDGGVGALLVVPNGIGTTNRFIARDANASVFLRAVRENAPKGARIVFAEAMFGNVQDPGFIASIGDWANAARWQVVLLFIVVIFTLGRRFGVPIHDRVEQRGARELVDALGDTLDRGRQAGFSLSLVAQDVDLRLRRQYGLMPDAPRSDRDAVIPAELASALREAEAFENTRIRGANAAVLARRLLAAMAALEGSRPGRTRRR